MAYRLGISKEMRWRPRKTSQNGVDHRRVARFQQSPRQDHHGGHRTEVSPLTDHFMNAFTGPSKPTALREPNSGTSRRCLVNQ